MQRAELEKILEPISAESPCGPDLDLAGDDEFMDVLARAEGMFPGQYFDSVGEEFRPFSRGSADFESGIAAVGGLLRRSRDVRLLVTLAKFYILDRKLSEFVDVVEILSRLVEKEWDDLNPKSDNGDFQFRNASIQALEDWPHVLYPLQYAEIIRHPRYGVLTWRGKELLDGAEARPGEPAPNPGSSKDLIEKCDIEVLVGRRNDLDRLTRALDGIAKISRERSDGEWADLEKIRELSQKMTKFLDDAVLAREPQRALRVPTSDSAAETVEDGDQPVAIGPSIDSVAAAAAALAAAADYFQRCEPSNPALLLIRQAEQLVGRTFSDVMRILLPDYFDSAAFEIGRRQTFQVPVHRIAADGMGFEGGGEHAQTGPVADRAGALALLGQVEAFYNAREPTSPIPFFCERARKVTGQDFLSLLREILPEHTLKTYEA